jgi:hypothetical protein
MMALLKRPKYKTETCDGIQTKITLPGKVKKRSINTGRYIPCP